MIRTLFICSALVASSAAGAVALAALHDTAGSQEARLSPTQAAPAAPEIEARFVIPSFAPSKRAEPLVVSVPAEPVQADEPPLVLTPLEAVVEPEADPMIAPVAAPKVAKPKPVAKKKRVTKPVVARAPVNKPRRSKARPVIVAQAPSFIQNDGSVVTPDYIIGVYR